MLARGRRAHGITGVVSACVLPLVTGCAEFYFNPVPTPPGPAPHFTLQTLPFDENWTGLVYNGNKIGFTGFQLSSPPEGSPGRVLHSEAAMHFRFLGIDKKVTLIARDHISGDLTIIDFAYNYDLDGNRMSITGSLQDGAIETTILTGGGEVTQSHAVSGKIYPASVLALYPVLHGLEVRPEFVLYVYDGETRCIAEVRQQVAGYERRNFSKVRHFG